MGRSNPTDPSLGRCVHSEFSPDLFLDLLNPRDRRKTGCFVAEGPRFLIQAFENKASILGIGICPGMLSAVIRENCLVRAKASGIPVLSMSESRYLSYSRSAEPSGIIFIARQQWEPLPPRAYPRDLWIGCEHLRSSGNFGTLIRSAVASGATRVVIFGPERDRTDPFDPGAVRSSMGAIFQLKFSSTSHTEFRRWRARSEISVFGATGEAATDYRAIDYRRPVMIMMGNERSGLSDAQLSSCDDRIRIPMAPGIDSLNVAMAATVLLYEVYGQRHPVK